MRRRAAHVEVPDRAPILSPLRSRPEEKELFERELALKDVPLRQAELPFEVERRQDLAVTDDVLQVRGVLGDRVDDGVAEFLPLLVPRPFLQVIRRVLDE